MDRTDVQTLQNKAQLPGSDLHDLISILRPFEPVLLKSFLPKAKTISIPVQNFEDRSSVIAEYEKVAGKRIQTKAALNQNRKCVDRLAHIRASRGKKNANMGRRQYHRRPSTRITCSRSWESNPLPISMRKRSTTRQSCGHAGEAENRDVLDSGNSTRAGVHSWRDILFFQYRKLLMLTSFCRQYSICEIPLASHCRMHSSQNRRFSGL